MTTDAILRLETLRCVRESDGSGGSEPYLWPALMWVDAQTLSLPERVGVSAPLLAHARQVVKSGMRAGQSAAIPNGTMRVRMEDGSNPNRPPFRRLMPIVALWENDETPIGAARAGYTAYMDALRRELREAFSGLGMPGGPNTETILTELVPAAVRSALASGARAMGDGLSGWERFQVAIGSLNMDDFVAPGALVWTGQADERFTMTLRKDGGREHYEIDVGASLQPVKIDPCQALVDAVRARESEVNGIQAQIGELQDALHGGGSLPKPAILAEIARLREEELGPAMAALDDARAALEQCRRRPARRGVAHLDGVLQADTR